MKIYPNFNIFFCCLLGAYLLSIQSNCFGTTIIAIQTLDSITIAADSKGTFLGSGKKPHFDSVCKIFRKGRFIYSITGIAKDINRGFDPAKDIEFLLHDSKPFSLIISQMKILLNNSFKDELENIRIKKPSIFYDSTYPRTMTIFLASFERNQPIATGIQFAGDLDQKGNLHISEKILSCPGDCPNDTYIFLMGQTTKITEFLQEHEINLTTSPEKLIKFLVQLEIDNKSSGVGPPVDVIRLYKNRIQWLSSKPQCNN